MVTRAVVTVLGSDRPGIVARVSSVLADRGANIEDISQTIRSGLFAMVMLISLDDSVTEISDVRESLVQAGQELGVQVQIQHEDLFRYMHRV